MTAEATVEAVPLRRGRIARIRALFNPEAVPVTEIADLASDDLNRAWISGYEQLSVTGFWSIARRLPALLAAALRLAAGASRPRVVWLLVLQVIAGICQAVSLFATTGALGALIASGPTPDKISAALPSLVLIGALLAIQAGAVGVGQLLVGQLAPVMDAQALGRLQQLCTTVEAVAFDSAGWMDAEVRAERGAVSPRYLLQATVRVMRNAAGIIAAGIVLATIDPVLLPLLALTIAPKLWAQVRSARQGYAVWVRQVEGKRRQNQIAQLGQSVSYAPEVRALGLSEYLGVRYRKLAVLFAREAAALARATSLSAMAGDAASAIAMLGAYAALVELLYAGWLPLALGGTAFFAIGRTQSALLSLVSYGNDLYAEGLYLDGFEEFCTNAQQYLPKPATVPTPTGFTEITVEDVCFTYTGATRPAVEHATLTIKAGRVVALVGENGAAKTTLTKLLGRLYLPDSGRICWDGIDTAHMDPDELRSHIALVAQDGMRAPFTAAENIRIGAWSTTPQDETGRAAITTAAHKAGAHTFIKALPHGYDTLMDRSLTSGSNVSGGQWQRLGIARGLLKTTAALILADEPTAHLDAEAELAFAAHLKTLPAAVVLVTHRMNIVAACADHIYVLEDGTVTTHGTHTQLLAHPDNWYARAFRLQQDSFNALASESAD
ncbi:MAG: ABC transporter ATP-binding protein [Catenulispora sp.]|nr:ABC transporter ATP-binding protein [Catenulispora sp.]